MYRDLYNYKTQKIHIYIKLPKKTIKTETDTTSVADVLQTLNRYIKCACSLEFAGLFGL